MALPRRISQRLNTRSEESKQRMPLLDDTSKARPPYGASGYVSVLEGLIPEFNDQGACCGFSHNAKNAILADQRKLKDERMQSIYYGVQHAGKQITISELRNLVTTLGLEPFIKYPGETKCAADKKKSFVTDAKKSRNQSHEKSDAINLLKELAIAHLEKPFKGKVSIMITDAGNLAISLNIYVVWVCVLIEQLLMLLILVILR